MLGRRQGLSGICVYRMRGKAPLGTSSFPQVTCDCSKLLLLSVYIGPFELSFRSAPCTPSIPCNIRIGNSYPPNRISNMDGILSRAMIERRDVEFLLDVSCEEVVAPGLCVCWVVTVEEVQMSLAEGNVNLEQSNLELMLSVVQVPIGDRVEGVAQELSTDSKWCRYL